MLYPRSQPATKTFLIRIHQNLRAAVYCSAVAAGDAAVWDFGWSQLQEAAAADEARILMAALACTSHKPLLQRCVGRLGKHLQMLQACSCLCSSVVLTQLLKPCSRTGGSDFILYVLYVGEFKGAGVKGTYGDLQLSPLMAGLLPFCRYLSYTLNSTLIRKQDASFVMTAVASNRLGHVVAWDFVREHWDYMFTE